MPSARRRRGEEDEEPKETSRWLYIGFLVLICGSGLPVILPVIDFVLDWVGSSGYRQLSSSDESLSKVFFGGDPWVIYCRNGKEDLPGLWTATAKKHLQSEDSGLFSMGVLDCSAPFAKSGRNAYERFKLKPPASSHALFSANGSPPTILPWDWNINDPKLPEIQAVLSQLKAKTKTVSRIVSTTASLSDYCTSNKRCALILHNATMDEGAKKVLDSLMQSYRLVKWVRVDVASRYLSLEKSLPPIPDAPLNEPRVIFFKRDAEAKTKALSAKAHKGLFTVSEVTGFLEECLDPESNAMSLLKHSPYITKRGAKKAGFDAPKQEPQEPKKQPDSKPKKDQDDARKAQQKKESNDRRERERREKEEEDQSPEADEAEEEETGEDTIDLDDSVHEEV